MPPAIATRPWPSTPQEPALISTWALSSASTKQAAAEWGVLTRGALGVWTHTNLGTMYYGIWMQGGVGAVVGESANVRTTHDTGQTWTGTTVPGFAGALRDVACEWNSALGWAALECLAVGDGLSAARFKAGAWTMVTSAPGSPGLRGVTWDSWSRTVVGVGDAGTVLRYLPVSGTWTTVTIPGMPTLRRVALSSPLFLTVGDAGSVYESSDAGATWTKVTFPWTASLAAVAAEGTGTWLVAGDGGLMARGTRDAAGAWTWERLHTSVAGRIEALSVDASTGWVLAGGYGFILSSGH
jgi:photosystem II stability/assembly factor-like uncharacterized protein